MKNLLSLSLFLAAVCACTNGIPECECTAFGTLSSGESVSLFRFSNPSGARLEAIDYGCRIVRVCMPDRNGVIEDVVVGPDSLSTFESGPERFYGSVIGRYGNRINHAAFSLDGVTYELDANESFCGVPVQCHGGQNGYDRMMWEGEIVSEEGRRGVRFHRLSPDGEQGFPGNLDCYVSYFLTDDNRIVCEYEATTDKATVVNLSNHTYWNLKGPSGGYVMEHRLCVEADSTIQNNLQFCPDLILPVEGTPFDFREPHRVDYRLDQPSRQLEIMHGMSACWPIRGYDGSLRKAADLYEPKS